ncbi:MAG: NAD(P)/FAD-dependent oxidoreductase [Candidatus Acidiferrum sp.]
MRIADDQTQVVILGAGPAGLTAAYELSNLDIPCVVLEQDAVVGGLARTVEYKGFRFDIGGHRFYTKVSLVQQIWRDVLGDDLLTRKRLSRIYYKSRFFRYPLEPMDAIRGLGVIEALRCALSFVRGRLFPTLPEPDFATWVSNRFGRRLFETFFESFTEKVWGMECRKIAAEWAAQRIQGLSLWSLLRDAVSGRPDQQTTTLIKEFQYPRLGPGMLWSRMKEIVEQRGVRVILDSPVERVEWQEGRVVSVRAGGETYHGREFISSIPIRELIAKLNPAAPPALLAAGKNFHYRDFLTVALMVRGRNLFPDNWIYVHDSMVRAGRVQNYGNWSPEMTPSADWTCLGVEYFCNTTDAIWKAPDVDVIGLAKREMVQLGLVREDDVVDGVVVRMPKAYPVYGHDYKEGLASVRHFLATVRNLQLVGRNGMHRYNNQDHSMLTAILAARNVAGARFDLWNLSVDRDYLEAGPQISNEEIAALDRTQPLVPRAI